uniref:Protein kinase domain-containing protein n=1 Tax=Lates calcarifer TaxID=8187 RepID=A0A4W6D2W8_LATCA
ILSAWWLSKLACIPRDDFQVCEKDILRGKSCKYLLRNLKGEGSFGKMARCVKLDTMDNVAVKIVKKRSTWSAKKEVNAFKRISILDADKCNCVKFFESFTYKNHVCIVLKVLDRSLQDFMIERRCKPLHLSEIRVISQQMLMGLNALKSLGMVHVDIKLDNIMLVNHRLHSFRVKLIDFGYAAPVSSVKCGTTIQAIGYRAPEVILGLKMDEATDMWSLACVMEYLFLSQHL